MFRAISLCNIVHKLVTKVIANLLKPFLPVIISDTQGAFTQEYLVFNNIRIAFKILHGMQGDLRSTCSMVAKLDMSKAFDKVKWPFLANVMLRMEFCQQWVDLIIKYVKSALFSFLISEIPRGHIIQSRGIYQGDPISPYLFLFVSEQLSSLLKRAVERNSLHGYSLCSNCLYYVSLPIRI